VSFVEEGLERTDHERNASVGGFPFFCWSQEEEEGTNPRRQTHVHFHYELVSVMVDYYGADFIDSFELEGRERRRR